MMSKKLSEIENINDYIDELIENMYDTLIIIAVKDTPGLALEKATADKFKEIGIKTDLSNKHGKSFLAVINKGCNEKEMLSCKDENVSYSEKIDDILILVKSSVYKKDNIAQISINHIDYAIDMRGINIVVYNWNKKKVLDTVCFDTHVKHNVCYREKDKIYNQAKNLEKKIDLLNKKLDCIQMSIETELKKQELILWQCFRRNDEKELEYKKRFFKTMAPASGNLRKMQMAGKILLENFDRICRNNGITYWISFGTLLGAVRHGGFIPWDDDTDVCMLREDLLKLKKVMEGEEDFYIKDFYAINENVQNVNHVVQMHFMENDTPYCMDIFVYDYCSEIYSIDAQKEIKKEYSKKIIAAYNSLKNKNQLEKMRSVYDDISKDFYKLTVNRLGVGKSREYIGWAIDNLIYNPAYRSNCPVSEIFPLEEIEFEGHKYFAPKNPEKYVNNMYVNIYTIPNDIISHKHFDLNMDRELVLNNILKKYSCN